MPCSLTAAAAATGLNKTIILQAIKSGKITGIKDAAGQWQIELAAAQRYATSQTAAILAEAHHRVAVAEQKLADTKAALDDMRGQRDKWQEMAERLSLVVDPPVIERQMTSAMRRKVRWGTEFEYDDVVELMATPEAAEVQKALDWLGWRVVRKRSLHVIDGGKDGTDDANLIASAGPSTPAETADRPEQH